MSKGPVSEGLGRAERLSEAGEYEAALEELDRLLGVHPNDPAVQTARGWALENIGSPRLPEAREAYLEALRLDPNALWAKEGLSNVLRRLGQVEEANRLCLEVIEEGTRRFDVEEDLRELVGWCQLRLGMSQEAVNTLGVALRLDGRWTAVRFDLALALLCAGDRVRAVVEYQRGIHQAENGGIDRLRGVVRVALDDLEEALGERPALAASREAMSIHGLLRSTLLTSSKAG
jgi:tetratricopeptide (TPR) repeat protein